MLVLAGFVGLMVLAVAFVLGMRGAERVVARSLGLPTFRWFEVEPPPEQRWKRFVVRSVSALFPFAICVTIFFVVLVAGGVPESTTTVIVHANTAAHEAGMRDGDKVISVGKARVQTFDELRARVQAQSGPVTIEVEREGGRLELTVTPREGRIGVASAMAKRSIGTGEAAARALSQPLEVVASSARAFFGASVGAELRGPVGIVRETSKAADAGLLELLHFLGLLGSYLWPFAAALHLFDAVTGWVFRRTLGDATKSTSALRIARLRFSLHVALSCWAAALIVNLAAGADIPGMPLLLALLIPGAWALWPLLWASARELGTKSGALGMVLPPTLVPCLAPLFAIWMARRLGEEEQRLRAHPQ